MCMYIVSCILSLVYILGRGLYLLGLPVTTARGASLPPLWRLQSGAEREVRGPMDKIHRKYNNNI